LGWQFAFIGVFAMIGGAIRAYNLPLVLAGLIVATLILQWRWVRQTIGAVSVERRLPGEAFAGQPFDVRFVCTNRSRWLSAWLIRIDDKIRRIDIAGRKDWLGRKQDAIDAETDASCGIGVVPCLKSVDGSYSCVIRRRGRYDFGPIKVSSGAPLGLLSAEATQNKRESFYVFPARVALTRHWRRNLQSRMGGNATTARRSGVSDGEFFGIRGWQEGDSRRWIHWRTTARIGEPAVRQFEQHRRFEICIFVDAYSVEIPKTARRQKSISASDNEDTNLERVISIAATLATQLVATPSNRIAMVIAGSRVVTLSSGGGREQTVAMLGQLAELSPSAKPDLVEAVKQIVRVAGRPRDLVVLSTRTATDAFGQEGADQLANYLGSGLSWRWFSTADASIDHIASADASINIAVTSPSPA
jgi:uncharacterized protein (DUF58 family)